MTKRVTQSFKRALIAGFLLPLLAYDAGAQGKTVASSSPDSLQMIPMLEGAKPLRYITGAVSYISGQDISNVPGSNRLNSLSGRLTGFSVNQLDGLPGTETSSIRIRGSHSFVGSNTPLILVNGRRDDASMLEPNDIESITILKDAASTVLYGMNSSNGIILITTKRGKSGPIKVSYNTEVSFQQPTRLPKFLNSYDYATLYNEALLNDNPGATPKYDATALEAYRTGSDPFKYPNVDWNDQVLKNYSLQIRNNINITGGSEKAKYFVSGGYLKDNGIFDVDKGLNSYNTNTGIDVFNVRANVDVKVSKNLTLVTDVRAKRDKRNAPGAYNTSYDNNFFTLLYSTPANANPIKNADGSLAGTPDYVNNPYGLINSKGYSITTATSLSTFSELEYNFDSLLKGLRLKANFGFTNLTEFNLSRAKNFEVYQLNPNATTYTKIGINSELTTTGNYTSMQRIFDHSVSLNYDNDFGKHHISSMLMYDRDQIDNSYPGTALTRNFQGPKGSLSYRFNNKYLVDFSFAYQGNEQFPKNARYGFFPAISAGWIASDENFLKGSGIDFLKLRGSYGRTGNGDLTNVYFDYYGSYTQLAGSGAAFGIIPANTIGVYQNKIANPLITWEKNLKANVGLDFAILNNRLSGSFDYFNEKNKDIMVANAITQMYGAAISTPTGSFKNKGFEVQAGWNDHINEFQYFVNFNYSVAKNTIVNMGEEIKDYPWMYLTGTSLDGRIGYVFDRFFTEQDNMANLPSQSLLGTQQAGDLKYKDLNGDNIINDKDITRIGDAKIPERNFGASVGFKYKGFDFNVLFQGTENGSTYNSGALYHAFTNRTGNATEQQLGRWTPGSGQSALYPRLTLTNNNNFVTSSYWVEDNSFVRLKYMELGYTLPTKLISKIAMSGARIFINGNNMFLWDSVDLKDPEGDDNGLSYPLQRSFSIGLNVKF